jgi:hypothetical protein
MSSARTKIKHIMCQQMAGSVWLSAAAPLVIAVTAAGLPSLNEGAAQK